MDQEYEDLKKLLEENIKYSKEILNNTDKIRHNLLMRQVYFYIKLSIFAALIVFGIITIRPLIDKFNEDLKKIFKSGSTVDELKNSLQDVNDYRNIINNK